MSKSLPKFLNELKENVKLLAVFANHENYYFIENTVQLFYQMQINKFTNDGIYALYIRGMTYKELEKVTSRPFQSIATSLKKRLTEEDKKESRENRKLWVRLMNYVTYVYETDSAESWEVLQTKFPDNSIHQLKQMYRMYGGEYMFKKTESDKQRENEQIITLYDSGVTVAQISKIMQLSQSTIYYRIEKAKEAVEGEVEK